MSRSTRSWLYVLALAIGVTALNLALLPRSTRHHDNLIEVCFLLVGAALLNRADVRLDRGRLTLLGIPMGASTILLSPLDATLVGLASSGLLLGRSRWPMTANGVMGAAYAGVGASVGSLLVATGLPSLWERFVILGCAYVSGWVLVGIGLSIRTGEPVKSIVQHNFITPFYVAFAYLGLGALLISYLLDGSAIGYLLASIVFVMALALTDTIAGRRIRSVLETQLSDADRHLFHSRAVEGVVHNLRNHMANAVGYLKEIDPRRLDPVDRDALVIATAAVNDAVTVLRTLSQGATPKVTYAAEPIDLNELASRALGMARPRARSKEVQLGIRESPEEVRVKGDPLLLREVITNLVNNAVDAVSSNGHVDLSTGRRSNGWPYFSVADDGSGISEENRHRLFEPHFTTKEGGTGLGLFMSYGIVREHHGDILFDNNRPHGAIFTVVLPPFAD